MRNNRRSPLSSLPTSPPPIPAAHEARDAEHITVSSEKGGRECAAVREGAAEKSTSSQTMGECAYQAEDDEEDA